MLQRIVTLSFRASDMSPAMCCVVELENLLVRSYDAELIELPSRADGNLSNAVIICVALNFGQIMRARRSLIDARKRGAKVILYVFDAWNVKEFFYNPRRSLKSRFFPSFRLTAICDQLFVPFRAAKNDFRGADRLLVDHLPLGVDTSIVNGMNRNRSISVLGYGRQPKHIDAALSRHFNAASCDKIYYHTSHMRISAINDFQAHRRFFWKIAQSSELAIAYDHSSTGAQPYYSIVGQRWFECLAAGCVIIGRRPKTPEADMILNWENSTLEIPENPREAVEFIQYLLSRRSVISEIRSRNVELVRQQHDWTHRIEKMLSSFTG